MLLCILDPLSALHFARLVLTLDLSVLPQGYEQRQGPGHAAHERMWDDLPTPSMQWQDYMPDYALHGCTRPRT